MESAPSPTKARVAEVARTLDRCVPRLSVTSTVGIVGSKNGSTRQIGSGTLVALADERFVLTAAHVLRYADEMGMTVGVAPEGMMTACTRNWILTGGARDHAADDLFDIALYELDQRDVLRMPEAGFVRIADASFDTNLAYGYFLISGFPGIWTTSLDMNTDASMKSKLLQYGTTAFEGDVTALDGFDANLHFLLTGSDEHVFDLKGAPIKFRTRAGHKASLPDDLGGVSGSSVWWLGDLRTDPKTWTSEKARIVGIQTGVYRARRAIKATRWKAVSTLIYGAFPTLRPVIEMHARQMEA